MSQFKKIMLVTTLCALPVLTASAYWQKPIYEKPDGANVGARVTFAYKDDSMFHVNTKPGFVTDIQLRDGEDLTYVAGGDTKSWLIDKAKVGSVQHVYIKPMEPGKHTNIIVNTDMHTYRLDVWSSMEEYDPLITFSFPEDRKAGLRKPYLSDTSRFGGRFMNRDYEIHAKQEEKYRELIPSHIMDDGQRTYIKIPATNRYDMPVLYMINPWDKKRTLINYRVLNGYFVADTVMAHGILLYHQKYGIDFYNRKKAGIRGNGPSMREKLEAIQREGEEEFAEMTGHRNDGYAASNPVEDEVYEVPEKPVRRMRDAVPARTEEETIVVPVDADTEVVMEAEVVPETEPVVQRQPAQPQPAPQYVPPQPVQQPPVQMQPQQAPQGRYPGMGEIGESIAASAGLGGAPAAVRPASIASSTAEEASLMASVNRMRGPMAVTLDDGRVIRMEEDKYKELPAKLRMQLIAAGRVSPIQE